MMTDRLLIFIMLVSDNDDTHSKLRRPANYGAGVSVQHSSPSPPLDSFLYRNPFLSTS